MNPKESRRKWSAAEELRIALAGMHTGVEVSVLCRGEGLNPVLFDAR
jgi:transposase-like protein